MLRLGLGFELGLALGFEIEFLLRLNYDEGLGKKLIMQYKPLACSGFKGKMWLGDAQSQSIFQDPV